MGLIYDWFKINISKNSIGKDCSFVFIALDKYFYVISQAPGRMVLRNYEGVITTYTEPTDYVNDCSCHDCKDLQSLEGVSGILQGEQLSLEPSNLQRKLRNLKE